MIDYTLFNCGHVRLERDCREGETLTLREVRLDLPCPVCLSEKITAMQLTLDNLYDFAGMENEHRSE